MKILQTFLLLIAASTAAFSSPGGPLEHTRKIRVDPTVVEQTGECGLRHGRQIDPL